MMQLFNSVARKREKGFLVTCETLKREGVDTVEKAQQCQRRLYNNCRIYVLFVLMVGACLAMLFPHVLLPTITGVVIVCLYIVTSSYRAISYVKRYIRDILQADTHIAP